MIEITIDGKICTCEKGEYILPVAKRNGIEIPTLCHHEALPEQACCRLCLVETIDRGRSKIVVSCVFPVEKPIEVLTNSPRVQENRAVVLMLLARRAPDSPEIASLCKKYGAMDGRRFKVIDGEKCVMCGLCVQACSKMGTGAISTVMRGTEKKISTPYDEPSAACIGCLSCVNVCPTHAINFTDNAVEREIWERKFEIVHCEQCGAALGTKEELDFAGKKLNQPMETLCSECRQKAMSNVMAETFGI